MCRRNKHITPVLTPNGGDLYYLDLAQDEFHLGGSSFAQTRNAIGTKVPSVKDASYFAKAFNMLQELIQNGCKVCLLSHFGRPDGKYNEVFSLKQIIPSLKKYIKEEIIFSESLYGDKVKNILGVFSDYAKEVAVE